MEGTPADGWEDELEGWLEPFLGRLRRQAQRRWAPFYLKGLILPGERKSIEPMAAQVAPGDVQQLHHFVSTSPWATAPVEEELVRAADRLVGGSDAVLVVDDTALVKQGRHSVGVKRQYCGQLGKRANCQSLVSLTLARAEMPVCIGLRLFLPEDWSADPARRAVVGVPGAIGYRPKWQIGLDEIDRVLASGARFGCVLADAEYGKAAEFRHGLSERKLPWAVGILPTQKVYPADVTLSHPARKATGRPRKHPVPSVASTSTAELLEARPELFRSISWRIGTMIGSADHPSPPGRRRWRLRGAAPSQVRRAPGTRGRRAGRGQSAAPAGRRSLAGGRAPCHRRAQVLPDEPSGRHAARGPGRGDQGSLDLRADAPADEGRTRPRPLRGPLAGAGCTTTRCCASSPSPSSSTCGCGSGGKSAGTPPELPGPPPQPSLPAIRRHIVAALTRILLRCPHCRQRFEHHLRL